MTKLRRYALALLSTMSIAAASMIAYATVTQNISGPFYNPTSKGTAFIVVKSYGDQLSSEDVISGTGYVTPIYTDIGANYLGTVCLRANAIFEVEEVYTVSGMFYPMGS